MMNIEKNWSGILGTKIPRRLVRFNAGRFRVNILKGSGRLNVLAPSGELLEIPLLVVEHPRSVVNGEYRHPGGVAFVDHVGQQLGRQQEVLGLGLAVAGRVDDQLEDLPLVHWVHALEAIIVCFLFARTSEKPATSKERSVRI